MLDSPGVFDERELIEDARDWLIGVDGSTAVGDRALLPEFDGVLGTKYEPGGK